MELLTISRTAAVGVSCGVLGALIAGGAAHAITDTVFKYSTIKTGHYGLSPTAFVPYGNIAADSYHLDHQFMAGNGQCFVAPVNLPQGAKITAMAAWYQTSTNGGVSAVLFRDKNADGTYDMIGTWLSTDTSNARKAMNVAIPDVVVDNQHYVYSVQVCFNAANTYYVSGRITYTYANAGD